MMYIPMKDVAKRQNLSLKYIERIMPVLSKNKLVKAVHGKGGGYKLSKSPEEYRIGDILRLTETFHLYPVWNATPKYATAQTTASHFRCGVNFTSL